MDHWEERALPSFLTSTVEAVRSVKRLRQIARQTDAVVLTGHDPTAWPGFKHAPAYYDWRWLWGWRDSSSIPPIPKRKKRSCHL
jgi:hypothetical protein